MQNQPCLDHQSDAIDDTHQVSGVLAPNWYVYALLMAAVFLICRITLSSILPLMDFSEARYAEMARKMVDYNDWVVLWFSAELPFWGKPPAAFWSVAASFKLFGINEFASRLPSLMFTLATGALIFLWARANISERIGRLSCAIFFSSLLVIHTAGSVITDPLLALSTTLVMVSFWQAMYSDKSTRYAYLMWCGLGLGLLAKGPLTLVLCGTACGFWVLHGNHWQRFFSRIRLFSGMTLMLLIAAPWYYLAEQQSPGFFDYFIVGEHFKRFTETAWQGDLYGGVKDQPLGAIWVYLLVALLPWGPIVLIRLITRLTARIFGRSNSSVEPTPSSEQRSMFIYLLAWALTTIIFFSFAKNILITYVMPALPAFSILIALNFKHLVGPEKHALKLALASTCIIFGLLFGAYYGHFQYHRYNQKPLISKYQELAKTDPGILLYPGAKRFSATFYTADKVKFGRDVMQFFSEETTYVVVRDLWKSMTQTSPMHGRCRFELQHSEYSLWYCPAAEGAQ